MTPSDVLHAAYRVPLPRLGTVIEDVQRAIDRAGPTSRYHDLRVLFRDVLVRRLHAYTLFAREVGHAAS